MPNLQENIEPLAITMGEPAGIGPELISRIWSERKSLDLPAFVYFGSQEALIAATPDIPTVVISDISECHDVFNTAIPVMDIPLNASVQLGKLNPENGEAVIKAIDSAVACAKENTVSAVVTAPIHKAALYKAGFDAPGHTEYLARVCDLADDQSVMMLTSQDLRVVPVTIHISLAEVAKQLTAAKIVHAGLVTANDLRKRFGVSKPRLAIAGLNPHAGEEGAMGMEEATHIMPAVWELREHGVDATAPLPADTLFHEEARQKYDAVLCMYHDQALIPVKTLDFWGGVNVTLGLPIIRTSPDHGTATELAGQGTARADSMIAAIRLAHKMALNARASQHD